MSKRTQRTQGKRIILPIGTKFHWLTVISEPFTKIEKNGRYVRYFKCRCKCGNIVEVSGSNLLRGNAKSCGCYARQQSSIRNRKHGMWKHRLYHERMAMLTRCYNKNMHAYPEYGGRGITVCDEWRNKENGLKNFVEWAYANGYYDQPKDTPRSEILTIDRIDNNGPYAPWNCQWVKMFKQNQNRSNNRFIYDGEEVLTRSEFERKYGWKNHGTVTNRLRYWNTDAVVYAAKHPELKMYKDSKDGQYKDLDGFIVLIPVIPKSQDVLDALHRYER